MRFLYALSALLLAPATRAQETFYTLASPNEEVVGQFGYAVGSTGDLTGDGVGDLIVGASRELVDGVRAGRAYVFSGPTGALVHTLSSPHGRPDGSFGWSADGAGDVDLDGVPDLIVGAWAERGVGSALQAGRAYVFSGASGVLLHELHSPNEEVEGHFGHAVTGVGDVDGDGRADVAVGTPYEDPGATPTDAGMVYVFSGATGAFLRALSSPNAEASGQLGYAVAGVGDVSGDGVPDLLVGAPNESPGSAPSLAGRAHVFSGATGALVRTLVSPGEEFIGFFGLAVSAGGDITGDGVMDLLVGAPWEEDEGHPQDAGRAHLFSGATGAHVLSLASPGEQEDSAFGYAVDAAGDVDLDGVPDLLIGAVGEDMDGGSFESGLAHVHSGATGAALRTLLSPTPNTSGPGRFGFAVAGLGDVTGDGAGDVAVGAYVEGNSGSGRVHVFANLVVANEEAPESDGALSVSAGPNPMRSMATVALTLAHPISVRVAVYDALGREVAVLAKGVRAAGLHEAVFDASALPAGTYFVRAEAAGQVATRPLTVLR